MSAWDQERSGNVNSDKATSPKTDAGKARVVVDSAAGEHETQRLDKWLWFTRVIKTRSLATRLVSAGKVRVNQVKCNKPAQGVRRGDVITATIGRTIRVLQVLELGKRRGPAPEARALYEDLAPMPERNNPKTTSADPGSGRAGGRPAHREPGTGRPTKRERRQTDALRSRED